MKKFDRITANLAPHVGAKFRAIAKTARRHPGTELTMLAEKHVEQHRTKKGARK